MRNTPKNLTTLFVFCFILLFSTATSLKSACTGDVDLNGGNIINVDEIIYATPIPFIMIGSEKYASPFVDDGVFAGNSYQECPSSDTGVGDVFYSAIC